MPRQQLALITSLIVEIDVYRASKGPPDIEGRFKGFYEELFWDSWSVIPGSQGSEAVYRGTAESRREGGGVDVGWGVVVDWSLGGAGAVSPVEAVGDCCAQDVDSGFRRRGGEEESSGEELEVRAGAGGGSLSEGVVNCYARSVEEHVVSTWPAMRQDERIRSW